MFTSLPSSTTPLEVKDIQKFSEKYDLRKLDGIGGAYLPQLAFSYGGMIQQRHCHLKGKHQSDRKLVCQIKLDHFAEARSFFNYSAVKMTIDSLHKQLQTISNIESPQNPQFKEKEKFFFSTKIEDLYHEPESGHAYFVVENLAQASAEDKNLYEYMSTKGPISEVKIQLIASQLLQSLSVLHRNQVSLQFLNPLHILVNDQLELGRKFNTQVINVQMLVLMQNCQRTKDRYFAFEKGLNLIFVAPEVSSQTTGQETMGAPADIWSLGVILYLLMSGGNKKLNTDSLNFMEDCWCSCSIDLYNLVQSCLSIAPTDRPTADSLLQHAFIVQKGQTKDSLKSFVSSTNGVLEQYYLSSVLDSLICRKLQLLTKECESAALICREIQSSDERLIQQQNSDEPVEQRALKEFTKNFGLFQGRTYWDMHQRNQNPQKFLDQLHRKTNEEWLDQVHDLLNASCKEQQIERFLLIGVLKLNRKLMAKKAFKNEDQREEILKLYAALITHFQEEHETIFVSVQEFVTSLNKNQ